MARLELIKGGYEQVELPNNDFKPASETSNFMDYPIKPLTPEQFHRVQPTEELELKEVEDARMAELNQARRDNLHSV